MTNFSTLWKLSTFNDTTIIAAKNRRRATKSRRFIPMSKTTRTIISDYEEDSTPKISKIQEVMHAAAQTYCNKFHKL